MPAAGERSSSTTAQAATATRLAQALGVGINLRSTFPNAFDAWGEQFEQGATLTDYVELAKTYTYVTLGLKKKEDSV